MSHYQMPVASIPALLQPMKDRLAAATPGPWFAHQQYIDMGVPDDQHTISDSPARYGGKFIADVGLYSDVKHANSDLIVNAPTDQAKLIAAVEAIATLHKPERRWMPYEGAGISFDTEAEALAALEDVDVNSVVVDDLAANGTPFFEVCSHCKVIEDSPCDGQCTLEAGYCESEWPCKTVAALTQALGGDTA